ncbi:putative transcription factor interactor and regulator CCHC(Zn) family [Helianthus annuus]|nr:putative transcription factor interactor and regulator CCHC(Zn) family [Helianthus annuus]
MMIPVQSRQALIFRGVTHYAVAPMPVHYVQTDALQIQFVQTPAPQAQVQSAPQTTAPVVTQPEQQSFFSQEFVDWSSMPENLNDENFALYASNDSSHNEFCLMALESIQEGVESEEEQLMVETVEEVTEAVVTAVTDEILLGESSGALIEPMIDLWCEEDKKDEKAGEEEERADEEENPKCDCAMMAAAKVSPQVLEKLCSENCIIAFANIKEVNENLRNKILTDEVKFERSLKELKNKLTEKEKEISSLKEEQSITKTQLQTMVEKYQVCKKELESTQITCEKWVESCKGYEVMLEKQIKINVKFGVGYRKHDDENTAFGKSVSTTNETTEFIPTNKDGQEVKITDKLGNKITLDRPVGPSAFEEIENHQFKPRWSDECDILENFKAMDFTSTDGVKAPKAKVIPLKDIPAVVKTSATKESEKRKKKEKIDNLFCEFCEKRNHLTKDCFHLKAYDLTKTSVTTSAESCSVCGKTNHKTQACVYLKNFNEKKNEYMAKTSLSSSAPSPSVKFTKKQPLFVPVQTAVTKQLNQTSVKRDVQVTDAPPANQFRKGKEKQSYQRIPHVYEVYKKPFKPRVNRHPFGYQQLIGQDPQQWLARNSTKTVQTPDLTTAHHTAAIPDTVETPSKALLALESLMN